MKAQHIQLEALFKNWKSPPDLNNPEKQRQEKEHLDYLDLSTRLDLSISRRFSVQNFPYIKTRKDDQTKNRCLVLWFEEVGIEDVYLVGGKNASLGEMINNLSPKGVSVPRGFATTSFAYKEYITRSNLEPKLRKLLQNLDANDTKRLSEVGRKARELIENTPFPDDLSAAIVRSYKSLCEIYGDWDYFCDVAVRSSATAEDLPNASFAGQQETFLNVRGVVSILDACRRCFASLFTDRAITYRINHGFDHFKISLCVGVQKMVRSDLASSGVIFTLDTESGFKDVVLVTGSYGLGESVVQGAVNPDEFFVFKPTLKDNYRPIIDKQMGSKLTKMIYDMGGSKLTKTVPVPKPEQQQYCLSDDELLHLSRWAIIIEEHYYQKHGKWSPMDIEWAKDGVTEKLYIVQARPETVQSQRYLQKKKFDTYQLKEKGELLTSGSAVGAMIGQGKANLIKEISDMDKFKKGEVLVTNRTDPDWEPIMKKAAAIVTNQGGRTCHAAIVSRELGIPAIVGCSNTQMIKNGQEITIDCSTGEVGKVYKGLLKFEKQVTELDSIPDTKTHIYVNIANPQIAFQESFLPADGVGLARMEFIISSIKVHPMALVSPEKIQDPNISEQIENLTYLYTKKTDYFVERLASGISVIAASFYPKPVIVRFSDFKSNEYFNLLGGKYFEPKEENPMIGWRGASRYYHPDYKDGFALECQALKRVREVMGLKNIIPMIPFCRTVEEGKQVIEEMKKHGLERGNDGLLIYVMCEIPSNVILAEEFCDIFDGFSIGSNDLTQLTLGVDRDSPLVSPIFDERNPSVMRTIKQTIQTCKNKNTKIGICGQAPSDYPNFASYLVECGIDSISLNSDTLIKTKLHIHQAETQK